MNILINAQTNEKLKLLMLEAFFSELNIKKIKEKTDKEIYIYEDNKIIKKARKTKKFYIG